MNTFWNQFAAVLRPVDQAQELDRELHFLRAVIDYVPDMIYVKDLQHRFVLVNQAVVRRFGFKSPDQMIGKTDLDLFGEAAYPMLEGERRIFEMGEPSLNNEFATTDIEGRPMWVLISKMPLRDADGNIIGLIGVNRNITERKLAEEQINYQANLISNISDAVISTHMDYTIASWNASAEAIYGWTANEVIGKPLNALIIPSQWPEGRLAELERELMAQGYWKGEVIHQRRDGSLFPVLTAVSLVLDSAGAPMGAVAVNRDMTESKQAEQQRLDLALERERVDTLRRFISDVTHDLKNPLSSIKINLYLLEKMMADPSKRAHHLENLTTQVSRLETMLDDLLTMARLDQVAEEFVFKPSDINGLVAQVVADQEAVAARRTQKLTFDPGAALPPVMADSGKLYRALTNLVVNALKYTQDGGHIHVSTQRNSQGVMVTVQDNGIGISAEDLPHIFDRFYQVKREKFPRSYSGGSGLGLAIAKHIIEAHRGEISVESTLGKGSAFRVLLPFAADR